MKTSMTVMAQALLGQVLYEYAQQVGEKDVSGVNFAGIMSNAVMPLTEDELYIGNRIVTPITPLACSPDLVECAKKAK